MKAITVASRTWIVFALVALACCSGCSIFVENRYSVFGFAGLQTESSEQARFLSLVLLGGVGLGSAVLGAFSFYLTQKWLRRRKQRMEDKRVNQPLPEEPRDLEKLLPSVTD
jgi:hypothetical protein